MGSLGEQLLEEWGGGRKKSFTAKGWHAQISKLTEARGGDNAARAAGLDVSHRTLLAWLAETQEPTPANRARIARAYEFLAGGWDPAIEQHDHWITGSIVTGADDRTRTLRVEAYENGPRSWARIRERYQSGDLTPDEAEELFIEDVIMDNDVLGNVSEGWEFPGSSYSVAIYNRG